VNAVLDIAITLAMLAFLGGAIALTTKAATAVVSLRQRIRRGPESVSGQAKRSEIFRPSVRRKPVA
jgi:hypothetical protein